MPLDLIKRSHFPTTALLLAAAFASMRVAFCETPLIPPAPVASPAIASGLVVLPDALVKTTAPDSAHVEIGPTDPVVTPMTEQLFRLKNTSAKPITLSRLRASCGCETLLLSKGGVSVPTAILAPGEQAEVRIKVKLTGQRSGLLHKYAWVYGPQGEPPLATLEMAITIREAVSFSPSFLDFGAVASQSTHALPLTVTVAKNTVPTGGLPLLASPDPNVHVVAQGALESVLQDGKPALRQNYEVTLAAPLNSGRIAGDLRFQEAETLSPSFRTAFVPLGATVVGSLSASPKTVFLGSVMADQAVTRQVLLSVAAKDAAKSLRVISSSPWLLPVLAALDTTAADTAPRLLSVTLKVGAPPGPLQAQIEIVSETGERLQIPVVAEIVRAVKRP
jgi:hypothetical protein